ncbi:bestrophin family protein [Pseudooceanicola sp. CBS1P-1]|uniref:Bestrophin n=1 Tax=Pseudooceanicola albus TaxID=2692189 RepID=A0A6L7G670_9RHOB|nr:MULTISPECIES: bestrophin family protein [Pseudooceanicola]MBT9385561.1 bestrophin family protein [Pseudooceanicola endophyticus]MXN19027.1 bestrophin [Pseudooceanicola albus]
MILRKRPSMLGLFFVLKGSVIQRIWMQVTAIFLIGIAVVWAHRNLDGVVPGLDPTPFSLIGVALSIFLSFRNGACYDRWWEARKLWGLMIQTARDIQRQSVVLEGTPERRQLLLSLVDFARRSGSQLRGKPEAKSADDALAEATRVLSKLETQGRLSHVQALVLHESLNRMNAALLGCERLANTPVPFAYTLLLHRTAYIYCTILPVGFVDTLGWVAPFVSALVAYAFFGLDALAEELEEPFSGQLNALPLSAYATTVEISMRRALGDTELPEPPKAVNFVLS